MSRHWSLTFTPVRGEPSSTSSRPHCWVLCLVTQSSLTLCDPMDCRPPDSSVHGILQAKTLDWIAMRSSRESSQARDWTQVSDIAGRFFTNWAIREALYIIIQFSSVQSLSRVRLFATPMKCNTPGLPVHHQLPEFTQILVHRVSDAIQPSHPLSSPSPPSPYHPSGFKISSLWELTSNCVYVCVCVCVSNSYQMSL